MPGPNGADCNDGVDWSKAARIAAGFVVGILLVWAWQEQGKVAAAILSAAVGVALGIIAFSLSSR